MYEKFYGLKGKPFQLSPDPRFFYASRSHKRAMAYLLYGVKQGEGFIVVTGDVGTGKTTLVNNLLTVLKNENVMAAQIVTTQIEEDDLLRMVAAAYGLPYEHESKAALLRHLEEFFRSCYRDGQRVLLIVDEAQNLPGRSIEELRMLSNYQEGGHSLVQSFLLGQKEFRVTMRSQGFEQLRQRVIAAYHLKPLDPDEAKGYVQHRLRKVGWRTDPLIADEAYQAIHEFTDGVPRRINLFCDRIMLYAYLEEMHRIDRDTVAAVAKDVVEEQGGAVTSGSEIPHLTTDPPSERMGAASLPQPAPGTANKEQSQRLDAVEDSVAALTEAMRQELSLLRKALTNRDKPSGGEGPK